jgi:regulator of sigma E protease
MAIVQTGAIFSGLYKLVTSGLGLSSLGGPVKIAQLTGQVADMGIIYLMQFTAFLSLNLAVLNIMPFPALDGGRVVFLIIEKIRGKRNNQKFEQMANAAGFALLLLLMLVVTIKDVKGF